MYIRMIIVIIYLPIVRKTKTKIINLKIKNVVDET